MEVSVFPDAAAWESWLVANVERQEGVWLKYVPRRPNSLWSQVNVEKVEKLTAAGRMREPGLAEVRAAQADGRWDAAYESQKSTQGPPAEVVAALADHPEAQAAFAALDRTAQYRLYLPVLQARTPQTKAARLAKLLTLLAEGERPR